VKSTFLKFSRERGQMARELQDEVKRLGGEPDVVARVIERAIRSRRPRTRYRVTASARLMIGLRRTLPDRLWDALLASSYPRPGR